MKNKRIFFTLSLVVVMGIFLSACKGENEIQTTNPATEENTHEKAEKAQATIKGSLTFPSDFLPEMKVCAVNTETNVETCTQTELNQGEYEIVVTSGSYYIYAQTADDSSIKAYYTACDRDEAHQTAMCSSSADDASNWNHYTFKCAEDATCKAAFTPLVIEVDKTDVQLNPLRQGWYIPCSYDTEVCNDPSFDVWADFLE